MLTGRLLDAHVQRPGIGVVGKIKIGEKRLSPSGKEYPAALDYFRVDAPAQYARLFTEAYGERPQKLEIIFISDDPAHACSVQYELRGDKGGLFAKGDGETFAVWSGDKWVFSTLAEILEKYGSLETFKTKSAQFCNSKTGWKVRLTMRFMIPRIKGLIAEWQLSTSGIASSIGQITGAFDQVKEAAGTVINLPFDLSVEMAKGDRHGSASRFPVLKLIPNATFENLKLLREHVERGFAPWKLGILTDEKIMLLESEGNTGNQ